ncbi:hypothetical protein H0H87_002019 [Tephrocybe sp. NHM501043]|nr:hypothetical protein H0H87_002019 [Tephrocybe sp. NHM501043]
MQLSAYPAPVRPVIDDTLLLSDVVDFNMKNNPTQPFFVYYANPEDGVQIITHLEFGRATNRVAHAVRPPSTGRDGDIVAILAHTDTILYQTIVVGVILAGLVPFPISPRNTPAAVAELLRKTSCHHLTTNVALQQLLEGVMAQLATIPIQIREIPSIEVVYLQLAHEALGHSFEPYDPPRRPAVFDVCTIIHFGSTGPPKPIAQTHLYWIQALVSPFIHAWSAIPQALEYMKELEFVAYTGAPLLPKVGNELASAGVRLNAIYGSTETGSPCHLIPEKENNLEWEYLRFYPHTKLRWIPQGDDTFELQFLACKSHRPLVNSLPDVEGYTSSDIFKPHPTKEGLWKIVGRVDDVIIHSSGEKTVPGPMEAIIMSNPLVQATVMFGREQIQTGALIQLESGIDIQDEAQVALIRNKIWHTIEKANKAAPAFSKLYKEIILFTPEGSPLPLAGKGTVLRKSALSIFAKEISALYENVDSIAMEQSSHKLIWDALDLEG